MAFDLAAAFAKAKPGDTILCPGDVVGPVKLLSIHGGEPGAPIVIDLGGHTLTGGLKGLGTRYVTLRNGRIVGGVNGVQFSQSGALFTALCAGLLIEGLTVSGVQEDAIKVSQASDVTVRGCTLTCGLKGQCVDYLFVAGGAITGNDCTGAGVGGAIAVKGDTTAVQITGNVIHDLKGKDFAAIEVGGYIDLLADGAMAWVADKVSRAAQAHGVGVMKNTTRALDGPSLRFTNAVSCAGSLNTFDRARLAVGEIGVQPDNRGQLTTDLTLKFNGAARVVFDHRQDAKRDRLAVS